MPATATEVVVASTGYIRRGVRWGSTYAKCYVHGPRARAKRFFWRRAVEDGRGGAAISRRDRAPKLFKGAGQNRPAATPWTAAPHPAPEPSGAEEQRVSMKLPAVKTTALYYRILLSEKGPYVKIVLSRFILS
jgi:hypothetical protein